MIPTAAKYQRYVRWWWTMISDQPWGTWIMLLKRGLTSILMSEWPHWPDLNEDSIVLCINSHRLKDGFYGQIGRNETFSLDGKCWETKSLAMKYHFWYITSDTGHCWPNTLINNEKDDTENTKLLENTHFHVVVQSGTLCEYLLPVTPLNLNFLFCFDQSSPLTAWLTNDFTKNK